MKLTTIREIYKNREAYLDKEVTVGGWVRSVRDSKTFGFIVLHDGSYFETLDKLEALVRAGEVLRFYPGHGYPIEDPLPIIEATRTHREGRLNQVREALAAGTPANPEALFDVVYRGVDPALRAPSLRSIRAQLKYLGVK